MKGYTKRLRENFFLWQIKLFGNLLSFLFFSFFFLFEEFKATLGYSENIFIFHVTLAWLSIFLYVVVLNYYFIFKKKLTELLFANVYVNTATILSGLCWGKLSFGFFIFYDSKMLTYSSLLIFLLYLHLLSPKSVLFGIIGFFLLFQERASAYFVNSAHQSFIIDVFSDVAFTGKTVFLIKNFIVILTLFSFCLTV